MKQHLKITGELFLTLSTLLYHLGFYRIPDFGWEAFIAHLHEHLDDINVTLEGLHLAALISYNKSKTDLWTCADKIDYHFGEDIVQIFEDPTGERIVNNPSE